MGAIHKKKIRFTLIELLVVVALSSVLMSLGLPAFRRMLRGNKVEECAGNIKLGLEQAQLRAASERRYVAVCFPNGSLGGDTATVRKLEKYRLGGFRLAYVEKQGNNSYNFVGWLPDSGWNNPPSGAILTRVGTSRYSPADNGDVTDCTGEIADALVGGGDLRSLSGVTDDDGNSLTLGNNFALIFTPYGGAVGTANLYLLIAEGFNDGGTIMYPTAGQLGTNRAANYLVLRVNKFTGRVEYGNE